MTIAVAFLEITSATITPVLEFSEIDSNILNCKAAGYPPPITITWIAVDILQNNETLVLSNDLEDVEISFSMDSNEDEAESELILAEGRYDSPLCRVTNGNDVERIKHQPFELLDPITGVTGTLLCVFSTHTIMGIHSHNYGALATNHYSIQIFLLNLTPLYLLQLRVVVLA